MAHVAAAGFHALLVAWRVHHGAAQTYQSGIGKSTHCVSDALRVGSWFREHMSLEPILDGLDCPGGVCACGAVGRVQLDPTPLQRAIITDSSWTSRSLGPGTGYGLHAVTTSSKSERLAGELSIQEVEHHMTRKILAVSSTGGYDAFLDLNTGFWVEDLDPFVQEFANTNTLALEWRDEVNNKTYFSLIVQVAESMMLIELMSARQTLLSKADTSLHSAPHPRYVFRLGEDPEHVFGDISTSCGGKPMMHAARLSHYTSDVARDAIFYSKVFGRDVSNLFISPDGVHTLVLDFADMTTKPNHMQFHLVQRPPDASRGDLSVAELEQAMHAVHNVSLGTSDVCGYNVWMDVHFALAVRRDWQPISDMLTHIHELGNRYFVMKTWPNEDTVFVVAPNGLTVQLHTMANGDYLPSAAPLDGHDGLCDSGPPSCRRTHDEACHEE